MFINCFKFLFPVFVCVFSIFSNLSDVQACPVFPVVFQFVFQMVQIVSEFLDFHFFLPTNAEPRELPHPPLTNVGDRIFELRGHLFLPHRQGRVGDPFWKR